MKRQVRQDSDTEWLPSGIRKATCIPCFMSLGSKCANDGRADKHRHLEALQLSLESAEFEGGISD